MKRCRQRNETTMIKNALGITGSQHNLTCFLPVGFIVHGAASLMSTFQNKSTNERLLKFIQVIKIHNTPLICPPKFCISIVFNFS